MQLRNNPFQRINSEMKLAKSINTVDEAIHAIQEMNDDEAYHFLNHPNLIIYKNKRTLKGTQLTIAAAAGKSALVKKILPELDLLDTQHIPPIIAATENNHPDIVDILLKSNKTDPNITGNPFSHHRFDYGQTALHIAASRGYKEIAKLLLNHDRTKPNICDNRGDTALTLSISQNQLDITRMMLTEPYVKNIRLTTTSHRPFDAIKLAISRDNVEALTLLLDTKADPTFFRIDHESAVHYANMHHSNKCLQQLIIRGADINAKNLENMTPLYAEMERGNRKSIDTLRYFLQNKADPNAPSLTSNITPLHLAAETGDLDAVKLLIEFHADVNAKTTYGVTPFILAAIHGHQEVMKELLLNGALATYTLHASDHYEESAIEFQINLTLKNHPQCRDMLRLFNTFHQHQATYPQASAALQKINQLSATPNERNLAFSNLTMFAELVSFIANYKSSNMTRTAKITELSNQLNGLFHDLSEVNSLASANDRIKQFVNSANGIKNDVKNDHAKHGALRLFGTKSRVAEGIKHAIEPAKLRFKS